jgi:hypothetical protein
MFVVDDWVKILPGGERRGRFFTTGGKAICRLEIQIKDKGNYIIMAHKTLGWRLISR